MAALTVWIAGTPAAAQEADAPAERAERQTGAASPPTPGYVRLADPDVAARLELTADQRRQLQEVLTQRAEALGAAAEADREAIERDFDRRLAELLTPVQRDRWAALWQPRQARPEQARLRFNFRFQPWIDVLNWFADQADLSLVLDAPPPGTFNYSDTREYTPAEAIDLLNGVLSTKGYTLVRRDRMLLLVDLSDGLPADLVPQAEVDQLDERGRYEFVSVSFQIGDRNADEVAAEIRPLLGEQGQLAVLPKTKQVLVTDTAGKMRSIRAVIESIPEPEKRQEAKPKEPEKPALAVYPVAPVEAATAMEVLATLVPDAKIVHDVKTDQLIAFATPSQQEGIKGVLDQIQSADPPEKMPQLAVYPIGNADPEKLPEVVRMLAPAARTTVDLQARQLVVWASPADQDKVRAALDEIDRTERRDAARTMQLYTLEHADPATVSSLISGLIPEATVSVDAPARRLAVLALPTQQQRIADLIGKIDTDPGDEQARRLEVYPLAENDNSTLVSTLSTLVPEATVTFDSLGHRLIVWARPEQQAMVADAIEKLARPADEIRAELRVYPVSVKLRQRIVAALEAAASELPGIRVVSGDGEPDQLAVWARRQQHAIVADIIEQLRGETPADERLTLAAYSIRHAEPSSVLNVLQTLLPDVRFVLDSTTRRLAAWAGEKDQATIRETIEQLDVEAPPERRLRLTSHALDEADASTVSSVLATLLPGVQVTHDPTNKAIIVLAPEADHELVDETIARLQPDIDPADRPTLKVYAVREADPYTLVEALATAVPQARLSADRQAGVLTAWATPADQEIIAEAVEQLLSEGLETSSTTAIYPLEHADPSPVANLLQLIVRDARIGADPRNRRLFVRASQKDHQAIRELLESLDIEGGGVERSLENYALRQANASTVIAALTPVLPEARLTSDATGYNIIAWATPEDHALIRESIERLESQSDGAARQIVRAYPLRKIDASTALSSLQPALPKARLTTDSTGGNLIVWGTDGEHETIAETLDRLEAEIEGAGDRALEVYSLRHVEAPTVVSMLATALPKARLTYGSHGEVYAWAGAEDQAVIRQTIDRLEADAINDGRREIRFYPLNVAAGGSAVSLLQSVLPRARLSLDPTTGSLMAFGSAADHEVIAETVARLEEEAGAADDRRVVVYPIEQADAAAATSILQSAFETARVVSDPRTGALLVWARDADHVRIGEALAEIRDLPAEQQRTTRVYRFERADPQAAAVALQSLLPEARLAVDTSSGSLVATARPDEHAQIDDTIAQLDGDAGVNAPQLRAYPVERINPADALSALRDMFPSRREVRLSMDTRNRQIIAFASPEQHETIQNALTEMQGPATRTGLPMQLEVHPLNDADATTVRNVLEQLFEDRPDVQLTVDEEGGQIVALAEPSQHATIRATIDQMQTAQRKVEVIPLNVVDVFSAQMAVEGLFGIRRGRRDTSAPSVESDYDNQQLLIRGTDDQIDDIKELLAKMGEVSLGAPEIASTRKYRVLPVPGATVEALLEELERTWSQVRPNPIRVVTPSAVAPTIRGARNVAPGRIDIAPQAPPDRNDRPAEKSSPSTDKDGAAIEPSSGAEGELLAMLTREEIDEAADQLEAESPEEEPQDDAQRDDEPDEAAEPPVPAPIVVAPGGASTTIASDDIEALNQFESLLRALAQQEGPRGRDYTIFHLQNADATIAAETLERLFRTTGFVRSGGVTIVPDERLNAVIVNAPRGDLNTIEQLLKHIDSADVPETLFSTKPVLIPVRNGDAAEVAGVIREVYRTQLEDRSRRQVSIYSRGSPRDLMSALSGMNGAQGPEMTLGVDPTTNSLVVMAPPPLLAEVREMVESLDVAAENAGRAVRIVPLTHANVDAVQGALDLLLEERTQTRRRTTRTRSR